MKEVDEVRESLETYFQGLSDQGTFLRAIAKAVIAIGDRIDREDALARESSESQP